MNLHELLQVLREFDHGLPVYFEDYEHGPLLVTSVRLEEEDRFGPRRIELS